MISISADNECFHTHTHSAADHNTSGNWHLRPLRRLRVLLQRTPPVAIAVRVACRVCPAMAPTPGCLPPVIASPAAIASGFTIEVSARRIGCGPIGHTSLGIGLSDVPVTSVTYPGPAPSALSAVIAVPVFQQMLPCKLVVSGTFRGVSRICLRTCSLQHIASAQPLCSHGGALSICRHTCRQLTHKGCTTPRLSPRGDSLLPHASILGVRPR